MHAETAEQSNKIILVLRERFKIPMILHQSEGKSMSLCFNYPHFSFPNSWGITDFFFFFLLFYLFQNVIQLESYNLSEFNLSLRNVQFHASVLYLDSTFIWRRKWQPTPVFLPGESHGWRSLVGCSPWGCTESDTTEAT